MVFAALACGAGLADEDSPSSPSDLAVRPVAASPPVGSAGEGALPDDGRVDQAAVNAGRLIASLTIFVLAIFVGWEVITKVPPTLHTPLMSGSNAVSGITLVGALIAAGSNTGWLTAVLGMIAVAMATVNVVGGFLVTHRMLDMFRTKK